MAKSDSPEMLQRDTINGKCMEAWFAWAVSEIKDNDICLEVPIGWNKTFSHDYEDRNTKETYDVKMDSNLNSGNIMFELMASTTEKGWGLRYKDDPTYIVFINPEDNRSVVVHAKPFINHVKSVIGPEFIDKGEAVVSQHLPERWQIKKVKDNAEGRIIIMPMKEITQLGFIKSDCIIDWVLPYKEFEKKFHIRMAPFKGNPSAQITRAHELVKLACSRTHKPPVQSEIPKNTPVKTVEVKKEEPKPVKEEKKKIKGEKENFVHLHVHSSFSLLDGVPNPEDIAERVVELGQPAVALTDHGYMFGNYKHFKACRDAGVKDIHGFEAYYVDDVADKTRRWQYHLILLAMNDAGWKNLVMLNTLAGKEFYYKPRVDKAMLGKHSEGLIVLSGCYKSPVSYHLSEEARDPDLALANMRMLKGMFGDRFYNEVMRIGWQDYDSIVPEILTMADSEGIKSVVTNDSHYARKEDFETQKVMLKVATGGSEFTFEADSLFLKSRAEMVSGYVTPAMADVSMEIMERITLDLGKIFSGKSIFPSFDISKSSKYERFIQEFNKRGEKK